MSRLETVKKIVVHCSDSDFGDASAIDHWHREKGWDCIGYHYVIANGVRVVQRPYVKDDDGLIEPGRPLDTMGAHVYGHNRDTLGICLIGKRHFSPKQLFNALPNLLAQLLEDYNLTPADVLGHYELDPGKTCPNLDMDDVRRMLTG